MEFKTIGVIGTGTMGSGIAQAALLAGFRVFVHDVSKERIEACVARISGALDAEARRGKLSEAAKGERLANLTALSGLQGFSSCELVIEAVSEDMEEKKRVFRQLDEICRANAILASNTSSLSITELADATRRPDKVIGMHFFNPVPVMALVEIILGSKTSGDTAAAVETVARKMGKTPVQAQDRPGFVANRLVIPMINEACFLLMDGVADRDAIDSIMKLGARHPMGPLALADLIGLDVCLAIMETLERGLGDAKYRPCPLLRRMVESGRLGRKTGAGFYDYAGKG